MEGSCNSVYICILYNVHPALRPSMNALVTSLDQLVRTISRVIEDRSVTPEVIDTLIVQADRVHHVLITLVHTVPGMDSNLTLFQTVYDTLSNIIASFGNSDYSAEFAYSPPQFVGHKGRPKIIITQDMLEYFIGNRFTVKQTAQLLQTSQSTIRRRMREYGISCRQYYSSISNIELDALVSEICHRHPNCGYRLMKGHLIAHGHRVQERRIRESFLRTDPSGIMNRFVLK